MHADAYSESNGVQRRVGNGLQVKIYSVCRMHQYSVGISHDVKLLYSEVGVLPPTAVEGLVIKATCVCTQVHGRSPRDSPLAHC